jgi:flagellar biosynthetic protein FlhB
LNPVRGFGNLFKPEKIVDLGKAFIKVLVLCLVAYLTLKGDVEILPALSDAEARTFAVYQLDLIYRLVKNILFVYAVIAAVDFGYQKWQYDKSIKMSKDEIKDEYKQSEGDPQVKRRIRRLQVEAARRRMMAEVPKADVVITNPTHYAVALRYDAESMEAPIVLAKGTDLIAKRIREIAEEHGVTLYRAPEIARALYRDTEPGDTIPLDMFKAVAEILAHVYRLTDRALPTRPTAQTRPVPKTPLTPGREPLIR